MIFNHTGHGVRNELCEIHGNLYRDLEQRKIHSPKSKTGKKTAETSGNKKKKKKVKERNGKFLNLSLRSGGLFPSVFLDGH